MITNEPVIIIRNLEHIPPYPAAPQVQVRGKEGYEKTKAPRIVRFEISSVCEVVPGYESVFRREYLVWCPQSLNDCGEIGLPGYDKGHIVDGDRMIER